MVTSPDRSKGCRRAWMAVLGVLIAATIQVPVSAAEKPRSLDEQFLALGRSWEGFGGLFFDDSGTPTVYLLDPDRHGAAVAEALGGRTRLRRGDYTFERLYAWRSRLRPLLSLPGLTYLDIDEATNRVTIGLDATSSEKANERQRLERALAASGVPREAVRIAESAPVRELAGGENGEAATATLRSTLRPAPGGVEISFVGSSRFFCTLGFNAYLGDAFGFVTNAHCTSDRGAVDGTRYSQGEAREDLIATEVTDPPFFTGSPCPPGRRCRFSDSAFVRYDEDSTALGGFGRIARPASRGAASGTLTLQPAASRFDITGRTDWPFFGQTVNKVGRSTGWTSGPVVMTCIDVNVSNTDVTNLCQNVAAVGLAPGDSGSPVFLLPSKKKPNAVLAGILWGSTRDSRGRLSLIFSPLGAVETELGPLRVR
jgi:hypothetical protein